MDRPGNELFARAGLTKDENRRVRRSYRFNLLQNSFQRDTVPDNLIEPVFSGKILFKDSYFLLQTLILFRQLFTQALEFARSNHIVNTDSHLVGKMTENLQILPR